MSVPQQVEPEVSEQRLHVAHLSKTFGPARVLRDVHLRVAPGEIHGLVGQNGCGKSTLVKILTGIYTPDPGALVEVDGQALRLPVQPLDARAAGVSVVHQNLGLVDDRTVWENVRLGRYRAARFSRRINRREEQEAVEAVLARLGRRLDIKAPVGSLSAEDRAAVAIARALQDHRPGGGMIIFDESTRALGRTARERFFAIVESVLAGGASVLLISHQLEEVVASTDRVTVLRDGQVVESGVPTREVDETALTRMMLGRHLVTHRRVDSHAGSEVVATVDHLAVGQVSGLDLQVRQGEIVGLTGLLGSGFEEVAHALGGARRALAGRLSVDGRVVALDRRRGSTEEFVDAGVALVPERRVEEGVALELSVAENLTLPRVRSRGSRLRIGSAWQADEAQRMITRLDIKPADPKALVGTLSGGNQQKVLLGKWLAGSPRLLVLHEPTQAVDVGARHDIIDALREAAAGGCAIVVASVDAADLAVLCDRVLVFRDGRVSAELTGDLDQDAIVHATFGLEPGTGTRAGSSPDDPSAGDVAR
ncbi:MAG TPA: sugar ABC transporter ATP-binding protein [Actinomycetes bacterium]|nr:sugar ABC transporter ATP-binding protein [Actinomycetes bacterium]